MLIFSDRVKIDTSGELRKLILLDGFYVVGRGVCVPVRDGLEADELIQILKSIEERIKNDKE